MKDLLKLRRQIESERDEQSRQAGRLEALEERLANMGYGVLDEAKEALQKMKDLRDTKQKDLEEKWSEYQKNQP